MEFIQSLTQERNAYIAVVIITTIAAIFISSKYLKTKMKIVPDAEKESASRKVEDSPNAETVSHSKEGSKTNSDDDDAKKNPVMPSPRYPDPVDYCEHIQGEIKRVQQSVATKSIAEKLTQEQLEEEREVQRRQLQDIFKLMQAQQERFGVNSMDDMQDQMRLYAV